MLKLLNVANSVVYKIGLIIQFIDKRPVLKELIKFTYDRFIDVIG